MNSINPNQILETPEFDSRRGRFSSISFKAIPSDITIGELNNLEKSFSNLPGQRLQLCLSLKNGKTTLTKLNHGDLPFAEALVKSLS